MKRRNAVSLASAGLMAVTFMGTAKAATIYGPYFNRTDWIDAMFAAGADTFAVDTFDYEILNSPTITFDSGVVSQGTGGVDTNEVGESVYFGEIDTDGEAIDPITLEPENHFNTITWTFPEPIIGFSADFFSTTTGEGLQITGNFLPPEMPVIDFYDLYGNMEVTFLGYVSETPFTQITFQTRTDDSLPGGNEFWGADNLIFGSDNLPEEPPETIPESSSVVAIATLGAILFGSSLKSKKLTQLGHLFSFKK